MNESARGEEVVAVTVAHDGGVHTLRRELAALIYVVPAGG